ncbi:hypothetical protein B4N89_35940 [Embleya scabrispora]|uniref:Exo-alpha-sialidase n=1 Tax=Embleya scabrispora TaxID=159449 RepID=A0A1T3NLI3_9ACTN|nr:hypothetical protein [Embleya scabrispora]OPC77696.1 hypothetical protein B4N89_35940 [Embleya scabrispora]
MPRVKLTYFQGHHWSAPISLTDSDAARPSLTVLSRPDNDPVLFCLTVSDGGCRLSSTTDGTTWYTSNQAPPAHPADNTAAALVAFHPEGGTPLLHLFWTDDQGDTYWSTATNGTEWSKPTNVPHMPSGDGAPAAAILDDALHLVKGSDTPSYATYDGNAWTKQPAPQQATFPHLAPYLGVLYCTGLSTDTDGTPYQTFDGTGWASQRKIAWNDTSQDTALAAYEGDLLVAVTTAGDHLAYTTTKDGATWAPVAACHTPADPSTTGVDIARFGTTLHCAYTADE